MAAPKPKGAPVMARDVLLLPPPSTIAAAPINLFFAVDISCSMGFDYRVRWTALVELLGMLATINFGPQVSMWVIMYGPSMPFFAKNSCLPDLLCTARPGMPVEECLKQQRIPLSVFLAFATTRSCSEFVGNFSTSPRYLVASIEAATTAGMQPDMLVVLGDGDINLDDRSADAQTRFWQQLCGSVRRAFFVLFSLSERDRSIDTVKRAMTMLALDPVDTNVSAPIWNVYTSHISQNPEHLSAALDALCQAVHQTLNFPVPRTHCAIGGVAAFHRKATNAQIRTALLLLKTAKTHDHVLDGLAAHCSKMAGILKDFGVPIPETSLLSAISILGAEMQTLAKSTHAGPALNAAQRNAAAAAAAMAKAAAPAVQAPAVPVVQAVVPAVQAAASAQAGAAATVQTGANARTSVVGRATEAVVAIQRPPVQMTTLHLRKRPRETTADMQTLASLTTVLADTLIEPVQAGCVSDALLLASSGVARSDVHRALFAFIQLGLGGLPLDTTNQLMRFVKDHSNALLDMLVVCDFQSANFAIGAVAAVPVFLELPCLPFLHPQTMDHVLIQKARVFYCVREMLAAARAGPAINELRAASMAHTHDPSVLFRALPLNSIFLVRFDYCSDHEDTFPNVLLAVKVSNDHVLLLYPEQPLPGVSCAIRHGFIVPPLPTHRATVAMVMVHHDCYKILFSRLQNPAVYGYQQFESTHTPLSYDWRDALQNRIESTRLGDAALEINRLYRIARSSVTVQQMLDVYTTDTGVWLQPAIVSPPFRWHNDMMDAAALGNYQVRAEMLRTLRPYADFVSAGQILERVPGFDPNTWPARLQATLARCLCPARFVKLRRPAQTAATASSSSSVATAAVGTSTSADVDTATDAASDIQEDICYICLEEFGSTAAACSSNGAGTACGACVQCTRFCTVCLSRTHTLCITQWRQVSTLCGMCRSLLRAR